MVAQEGAAHFFLGLQAKNFVIYVSEIGSVEIKKNSPNENTKKLHFGFRLAHSNYYILPPYTKPASAL